MLSLRGHRARRGGRSNPQSSERLLLSFHSLAMTKIQLEPLIKQLLRFMRKKKVRVEKHNAKIAIIFFVFVVSIVFASLIFKAVLILRQSNFDGNHRFTISVSNQKKLTIISFSPSTNSISVLKLDGEIKNLDVNRFLEIPIDGFVKASSLETNRDVATLLSNIIFDYKDIKTNLTIADIFRLFLVSKTTPLNDVTTSHISSSLESAYVDKIVAQLFNDAEIEKENQTVEIVNATSVTGLGARLARLITNMGGKVVQVSTENKQQKNSLILYNGRRTYTVEKLNKVLGFKTTQIGKQSIADITIVLGEGSQKATSF